MTRWIAVVSFALGLAAGPAAAQAPTINFDQGTGGGQAGGTLTYDGEGGPLIGTDIGFGVLAGFETPANAGVPLFCVPSCTLNFVTGANTAEGTVGGAAWTWAGGGSFTVVGTLNTQADGMGTVVATGTLLTGTFDGALGLVGPAGRLLVIGVGTDTKTSGLVAFYGLDPSTPFTFANTEIVATGLVVGANNSLAGSVTNSDLTNVTQLPPPPPGAGCLTRTPGFWGNHPDITALFLPVTVCGVVLNTVEAGSGTSATEAICSVGTDNKILGPQLTQLVRQCTAARLNVAASASGGGNCPGDFPDLTAVLTGCCGDASVCTMDPDKGLIEMCIELLDAFNNSDPDTLEPFGPFVSPGPADPSKCQDSKGNEVVVTPAP
jgi:hypothetical protein